MILSLASLTQAASAAASAISRNPVVTLCCPLLPERACLDFGNAAREPAMLYLRVDRLDAVALCQRRRLHSRLHFRQRHEAFHRMFRPRRKRHDIVLRGIPGVGDFFTRSFAGSWDQIHANLSAKENFNSLLKQTAGNGAGMATKFGDDDAPVVLNRHIIDA